MVTDVIDTVRQFSETGPVNIVGLIAALGIEYDERPMPSGASGEITFEDGTFRIAVNSTESPARKRFTAAHELAHFLLHRDLLEKKGKLNRHTDLLFGANATHNPPAPFNPSHEVQANRYAAELLMPASRVKALWRTHNENVADVAASLDVSIRAMEIRLKNLGLIQ